MAAISVKNRLLCFREDDRGVRYCDFSPAQRGNTAIALNWLTGNYHLPDDERVPVEAVRFDRLPHAG